MWSDAFSKGTPAVILAIRPTAVEGVTSFGTHIADRIAEGEGIDGQRRQSAVCEQRLQRWRVRAMHLTVAR